MSALGGLWSFNDVIDVVSLNIKTVYVGSVAPTITYSGQLWSNNVSNILYQRDSTNTIWNPVVGTIEGGTVGNFEIQDLLTVDELTNFKDTGNVIVQISGSGVITNVAAPSGNYVSLFCTVIDPEDHVTVLTDPILMVNQAFFVQKDLQGHGFLGTSSDPYKGYGGGAILMGQGFTGLYCPSMYVLTGTEIYPTDPIGSYPSGTYATMIALGSPVADQFYYTTDTKKLYQYISGSWVQQYDNVISGDYDTLFLIKSPSQTPANLYLANLTVRGHIYVKDTNAIMFDDAQDVYLYQNVANGNNILELAGTGMIIDGSLNVNAVSVTTSLGAASANVTGSITVGSNLYFTTNDDVYLYRNTVGSNHILELAGTGMIVDGYVNSSGLSINGNAGITGVLNIAQLTIATQAGTSGQALLSKGSGNNVAWGNVLALDGFGYIPSINGIHFTHGDIYANTNGADNIIEISGTGLIIDGYVNANGISDNGNLGVSGVTNLKQLTINGSAGSSGQVLQSNGAGNNPSWVNVSGLSIAWTQITGVPNFLVQSGGYVTTNIAFGTGYPTIYANLNGSDKIIEVSGTGVIIDGYLNVNAISVNQSVGISGVLTEKGNYIEINPTSGSSYLDFEVNSVDKAAVGWGGGNSDTYLVSYSGNLELNAPNGNFIVANQPVIAVGFGTASPTISDQTSNRYFGSYFQPNTTYNTIVYVHWYANGTFSGITVKLSSTNSGGIQILLQEATTQNSHDTATFIVPRGYWYMINNNIGLGNAIISSVVEESL